MTVHVLEREFTAKEVQAVLRSLTGGLEKIGLALLNYYARTNLVPSTGKDKSRGRKKYSYADLLLLCWLFRMKREGLPVNRFRRGIDYLRKKLPKLHKSPTDMVLLTDGRQLFIKHRIEEKGEIAQDPAVGVRGRSVAGGREGEGDALFLHTVQGVVEKRERLAREIGRAHV